jgi:Tol biopolymer transport system component
MIQISHQQAQRFLRARLNGQRLPDAQWAALQSHLETCASCRAYQHEMQAVEREIRRQMRERWSVVPGPTEEFAGQLSRRPALRNYFSRVKPGYALAAVLFLLLAWSLIQTSQERAADGALYPAALAATATPSPSPTPTQRPLEARFQGVILYETSHEGSGEIYLRRIIEEENGQTRAEAPVNLSDHPADDTHPAWSPDGEWIAFLSDRSGKGEVYVIHVAGTRLTQLTDQVDTEWHGPLQWSPDGRFLALYGSRLSERTENYLNAPQHALYLLPLQQEDQANTNRAIRLTETNRTGGKLLFSPEEPLLAFIDTFDQDTLMLFHLETGATTSVHASAESSVSGNTSYQAGDFDWSWGGKRLAYTLQAASLANTGAQQGFSAGRLRASRAIDASADPLQSNFDSHYNIAQVDEGQYEQVSWAPGDRHIAYLLDDGTGCRRVVLQAADQFSPSVNVISRFCAESGLERGNWSADGWLVLLGRQPGEPHPSWWAILWGGANGAEFLRLADDAPAALPLLRPEAAPLGLTPQPLLPDRLPPPRLDNLTGTLIYATQSENGQYVIQSRNLATGVRQDLITGPDPLSCPTFSTDKQKIAFLVHKVTDFNAFRSSRSTEVWTMDADGQNPTLLAQPMRGGVEQLSNMNDLIFECRLTWSSDDVFISTLYRSDTRRRYIAILPVQGGQALHEIQWGYYSNWVGPVWSPDGKSILEIRPSLDPQIARIRAINIDQVDETTYEIVPEILRKATRWNNISGLDFSASGHQMTYLAVYESPNQVNQVELRISDLDGSSDRLLVVLPERDGMIFSATSLRWLPGNAFVFVQQMRVHQNNPYRSLIRVYNPHNQTLSDIYRVDEEILSAYWSPDGHWLVYFTESGAWLLNVSQAALGYAGPIAIDLPLTDRIDWQ